MATASSGAAGVFPIRRYTLFYYLGVCLLLIAYAVLAVVLSLNKDWVETGPLAFTQPALTQPLAGAVSLDQAFDACFPASERSRDKHYKVVGGNVDGRPFYACYEVSMSDGLITQVKVLDADGIPTDDARIVKAGGAWPSHGLVTWPGGFAIGGAGLLALFGFSWFYYRRRQESIPARTSWVERPQVMWLVGALMPVVGWVLVALWPHVPWARRLRVLMQVALCYAGIPIVVLFGTAGNLGDHWALAVFGSLTVAMAYGVIAGRLLLWPVAAATALDADGRESIDTFDPHEIRRGLDHALKMSQGRLPQDVQAKIAKIRMEILELLPHTADFPMGSRDLFVVQRTATDYLPTSIEAFLSLPQDYATTAVLEGGKTALQVLEDQLGLLDWKMDEIDDAVRQRDSERLLVHGRFLEESFGRRSEDLE
jgi:hypothetical protein